MSSKKSDLFFKSIEEGSLLRKFIVLFFLISVIPVFLLFIIYLQLSIHGHILIHASRLHSALIFIVLGCGVGYWAMRIIFYKIQEITSVYQKMVSLVSENIQAEKERNELVSLVESADIMSQALEQNVKDLAAKKESLKNVIGKISSGLTNMKDIDVFLDVVLNAAIQSIGAKTGVLLLLDEDNPQNLEIHSIVSADQNFVESDVQQTFRIEGFFQTIILSGKALLEKESFFHSEKHEDDLIFKGPVMAAPLVHKNVIKGIIVLSESQSGSEFSESDLNLLFGIASQIALALEDDYVTKNMEKKYLETIESLALFADSRDKYANGHPGRVAEYCLLIARRMDLSESDLNLLEQAAKFHDLGKISIPENVLNKEGQLTTEEWELIKKHPETAESIMRPVRSLENVCDIIRHHHEKLDGSGYPDGLKGEEIPLLVRILSVADIFDALMSNRSYRNKFETEKSFEILRSLQNQIDQEVVKILEKGLKDQGKMIYVT